MPTKKTVIRATITESTIPDSIRKRVQFPASDQIVADWIDAQDNLSLSMRLMIHDEVNSHGIRDRVNRIGATSTVTASDPDASSATLDAETIARLLQQDGIREIFGPLLSALIVETS